MLRRDTKNGTEDVRAAILPLYMHSLLCTLTPTFDAAEVSTFTPSMSHNPLRVAVSPLTLHDDVDGTGEGRRERGQNLPAGGFRTHCGLHCGLPACITATLP